MLQIWRTPWRGSFLILLRDADAPMTEPSFFDVPVRAESWAALRSAILRTVETGGETYLAAGHQVLRVKNLFEEEINLHWLHRPHSWASIPVDRAEACLPKDYRELPEVLTDEYSEMSPRYAPNTIAGDVACPCEVLHVAPEGLTAPRPFGLELTPQEIWKRLAGPVDVRRIVPWGERVELYECQSCSAHWAATQISDGLAIRYESRRLTGAAFAALLAAI